MVRLRFRVTIRFRVGVRLQVRFRVRSRVMAKFRLNLIRFFYFDFKIILIIQLRFN